jgi:hypothetical protein
LLSGGFSSLFHDTLAPMSNGLQIALISAATGVVGALFGYAAADREASVKMIEVAVGILAAKPEGNIKPARKWAVDIINHYSDVKLPEDVKAALLDNPLPVARWDTGSFGSSAFGSHPFGGPAPADR